MAEKEVKLSVYAEEIADRDLMIISRDISPRASPPYLEEGTEQFDPEAEPEPAEEVDRRWGGRPNVPKANVIRAIRRDIGTKGYDLWISDRSYTGYTCHELKRFLRADRTNFRRYIRETFDCDDFAQILQGSVNGMLLGIPFGTIWYGGRGWGHAVNIFYCYRHDRICLVEPQNDRWYFFNKAKWRPWVVII